jgi:peptidoglycan/LPS O-acetylase OafA/YrhL
MRIKSFDCLRGYGAIAILFAHLPQLGYSTFAHYFDESFSQFSIGYILLDMFFAMSGFLITSIILKEKEKGRFSFKQFYINRSIRIFPVYYLTLLLVALFITSDYIWYAVFYLSNYFFSFHVFVHPLNHTWSLAVEEHFYLLWPILLTSFSTKTCKFILSVIIPAVVLLCVIIIPFFFDYFTSYQLIILGTTTRCLAITLGSYLAFNFNWLHNMQTKTFKNVLVLSIAFYLGYYCMPVIPVLKSIPNYARLVCLIPIISVLVIIVWYRLDFMKETIFKKLLLNNVANYFGKMSYGIYLFHYPIFYAFNMVDWQTPFTEDVFRYWLVISLVIASAALSYHFIELPLQNWRKQSILKNKNALALNT